MKTNNTRRLIALQIVLSLFFIPKAFGQQSGSWVTKSSNGFTARSDFAAAVVNGKIYVMGGDNSGSPISSLQVYDPTTDTWVTPTTTGTFTARDSHTAAVVDGKIYDMGGYDATSAFAMTNLEVFDPTTNMWSAPSTTGTFTGRGGLSSAVVNGKIYVMGGTHSGTANISNTLEVFDPAMSSWSTPSTTGTFSPRSYFTSSVVNGKIYAIGGTNSSGLALNTFEVFDPATNTWSTPATTGTFTPRADLASAVVGGKIYVMGGHHGVYLNTLEVFDPATNTWSTPTTTGTVPTARNALSAAAINGVIYAMGGSNGNDLNTNEAYTPAAAGVTTPDKTEGLAVSIFPNPAKSEMHINYSIPKHSDVTVSLFYITGITIATIANETHDAGSYEMLWDIRTLPNGSYILKLTACGESLTKVVEIGK